MLKKLSAVAISSIGGLSLFYYLKKPEEVKVEKVSVKSISSEDKELNLINASKWDANWDCRQVKEAVVNPKAVRHVILVRHGQYNLQGATDLERTLTALGRDQAKLTGCRLAELALPINNAVISTMTRAQETGNIILSQLTKLKGLKIINDSMIQEGEPIQEVPVQASEDYPLPHLFFQEGARIEAGFRAHFHRAPSSQETETYTLLVCHANVIRYFICRALQLPPEAWLRFNLHNASISWLSVHPNGRVALRLLGDCGHLPAELVTRT